MLFLIAMLVHPFTLSLSVCQVWVPRRSACIDGQAEHSSPRAERLQG